MYEYMYVCTCVDTRTNFRDSIFVYMRVCGMSVRVCLYALMRT